MVYRFKHLVVALSAALLMAFVFASCAPIADASVSAGSTAVNSSSGAEAEISINLPQIAARSNSLRSMTPEETDDARTQTASFRVTFSCSYKTVTREAVGVDTVSALFYVGTDVSVMVECLNSSGEVIVRTEPKTVKISSSENKVSFKLSEDGTRIYPENPEPEPEPEPPAVKYTVSYTLDGGDWSPNSTPPTAAEYSAGDTVTITTNEPTKQSNTFIGWKASPATVVPVDGNFFQRGGSFTMPASNVTLTAQWTTLQTYTVTFEKGSIPADVTISNWKDSENVIDGGSITLPTLSANGYTFDGWISDAGTSTLQGGTQYTPSGNVTLTAQWTLKNYTVTFNTGGGNSVNPITDFNVNYSGAFPNATKQGYSFQTWQIGSDAYTASTLKDAIKAGTVGSSSTTIALTAQWQELDRLYVADSGDDTSGDGSTANPFETIDKAIAIIKTLSGEKTIELKTDVTLTKDIMNNGSGVTYTIKSADSTKKTISTSSYKIQGVTHPIILENLRIISEKSGGAVISQVTNGIQLKDTTIEVGQNINYSAGFATSASIVMEGSTTVDKIKLFSTSYIQIKGTLSDNDVATLVIDSTSSSNPQDGTAVLKGDVAANYGKFKVTDENGDTWGTIDQQGILHKNSDGTSGGDDLDSTPGNPDLD